MVYQFLIRRQGVLRSKARFTPSHIQCNFYGVLITPLCAWDKVKAVFKSKATSQATNTADE